MLGGSPILRSPRSVSNGLQSHGHSIQGMLTRTKTTGKDKKILNRVLHVDRRCWLLRPDWLEVGWTLWQKSAPWERDFFLPVPTKALEYWERYECRYSEATVLSQVLDRN